MKDSFFLIPTSFEEKVRQKDRNDVRHDGNDPPEVVGVIGRTETGKRSKGWRWVDGWCESVKGTGWS